MYEQQILKILTDVGERGISVGALAKHVCNMESSLFAPLDLQDVRLQVQQYLLRNSKSPQSLIESTGKRGCYRLNTNNSPAARQLMLDFREEDGQEAEPQPSPSVDYSLNLFDD
ncbi:MAG: hypothetical protein IJV45_03410 [Prevotella sp.]|nr:hypothetical protein [Prevotella sp.]